MTFKHGTTGVFLDPPYGVDDRADCYAVECREVARRVNEWCLANGQNPLLRIVLCGYAGEHDNLEAAGWDVEHWKPRGGFDGQKKDKSNNNRKRERVWFSPHCLAAGGLFG